MSVRDDLTSIVKRLEAIEKIFAEYRDSIRTAQERERQLDSSPRLIRSEISFDDASKAENKTEADRQYRVQNGIRWSAFLAFCAALIYAGIALYQWIEMRNQTQEIFRQAEIENQDAGVKAAQWLAEFRNAQLQAEASQASVNAIQKQTIIARQQLEASTRPWIAVDFAIDGALTFDTSGARVRFAMQIDNLGHSPALNLDILPKVINDAGPRSDQMQRECAKDMLPKYVTKMNLSSFGDTVFPGRPAPKRFALTIPRSDLNKTFVGFPQEAVLPRIIGCVNYTILPSGEYHHTFFSYMLLPIASPGQPPYFMNGIDVLANQIRFFLDPALPPD
jgi:hypothetical protein